jgi:ABC-type glutathione transport system ATPase component
MSEPLLTIKDLSVVYASGRGWLGTEYYLALDQVSLRLERGEILGIVGESGCGKSTLARAILGLVAVQSGTI